MNLNSYKLAYEYKAAGLWRKMWDQELFAVKMPDEQIIYCCVMGRNGEYNALAVYQDEDCFQSYYKVVDAHTAPNEMLACDMMLGQDCLQCVFENKDDLDEDELKEVRAAAKTLGVRLSGKNSFAHFLKFDPYKVPYSRYTKDEEAMMCEALQAAVDLSEMLKDHSLEDLGIEPLSSNSGKIGLLVKEGDHYRSSGQIDVPNRIHMTYPVGIPAEEKLKQLKKIKRGGTLQCCVFHPAVKITDEEPNYFPVMLFSMEVDRKILIPVEICKDYDPDELVDHLINGLIQYRIYPLEADVADERTRQLMSVLCDRMKIRMNIVPSLDMLEAAYDDMSSDLTFDEDHPEESVHQMVQELLALDEEGALMELPDEVLNALNHLLEAPFLSESDRRDLEKLVRKMNR